MYPTRPPRSAVLRVVRRRRAKRPRHSCRLDLDRTWQQKLQPDPDPRLVLSTLHRYTTRSLGGGTARQKVPQMDRHHINRTASCVQHHCRNLTRLSHHPNVQSLCSHPHDLNDQLNSDRSLRRQSESLPTPRLRLYHCRQLGLMADRKQWTERVTGNMWKFERSTRHQRNRKLLSRQARQRAESIQLRHTPTAHSQIVNHRWLREALMRSQPSMTLAYSMFAVS